MKKLSLILLYLLLISCNANNDNKEVIYTYITDTITNNELNKTIIKLSLERDSLINVIDSLSEEVIVAEYKIGRIKYYNDVAANGNNIKFLRGWINRVLEE